MPQEPPSTPSDAIVEVQRKRANRTMLLVAVLLVIIPFLFWRGTWFGRALSDDELNQYISDASKPRHMQHALVQIGERMSRGDNSVSRWYPDVTRSAASPYAEIRTTSAWVMGGDTRSEDFHKALLGLLSDKDPVVRRNAALSLVRFGDASGKPVLIEMLHGAVLHAPRDGRIHYRVKQGDSVGNGNVVAEITSGDQKVEVHASPPGKVEALNAGEDAQVKTAQQILALSPAAEHVWEALRAFVVIGNSGDAEEIAPYANGSVPDMPAKIQQQAQLTLAAIRQRTH